VHGQSILRQNLVSKKRRRDHLNVINARNEEIGVYISMMVRAQRAGKCR
jgi:hypothetical protein